MKRPTPSDATAALRCAEEQRTAAWRLRADDEAEGARAVRRASRAYVRAELMVLASQGDREALALLSKAAS